VKRAEVARQSLEAFGALSINSRRDWIASCGFQLRVKIGLDLALALEMEGYLVCGFNE
jgi:hypothetical protein